ncbi:MAG: Fe-S protein assembly co-chaperone HscB [Rickettsiaceae bacterium]
MTNYFNLLNLKQTYSIDKDELENNYLKMQAKYHPDNINYQEDRLEFLEKSSILNNAYEILKNDIQRAEYLLKLNNVNVENACISKNIDLNEIYKQFELIDNTNNLEDLKNMYDKKILVKNQLIANIKNSLDDKNDIQSALTHFVHLKYINRLIKAIKGKNII